MINEDYVNGYVERHKDGRCDGVVTIDGVELGAIDAVYFKEEGKNYLWLKRKPILDYDAESQSFIKRPREPRWEAYLEKSQDGIVAYRGTFAFLRFKYSIIGVWDKVLGMEKNRLNLYIERLPMPQQDIINKINERKSEQ